jgi:hypothetical protein
MDRGKFLSSAAALTVATALLLTLAARASADDRSRCRIAWRKLKNVIATRPTNMASTPPDDARAKLNAECRDTKAAP